MKKSLIVFGTRPEAIKMAPLVKEFQKYPKKFETRVCVTAQHREMLDQVLSFFGINPDYDLDLMQPNQNLYTLTGAIVNGLKPVLEDFRPDYVFVHGDTTTTMAAGIATFYSGARLCHVEAGLRTFDMQSPFPEEMNRSVTGVLATYHFSPTEGARVNLLRENKNIDNILVTGNTVIDALKFSVRKVKAKDFTNAEIGMLAGLIRPEMRLVLVTGHRRENHGAGFLNICKALKEIALNNPGVQIIYPVHLNPNVQRPVYELLSGVPNISLISPLSYPAFVWLMDRSYLIITDSGGIQEEAPSLGKPVLVMRNTTERPEAVAAGTVKLVGTDADRIIREAEKLLREQEYYLEMSSRHNPYGEGDACSKIVEFIDRH
jgi:UDP-N-acetylglucosamine 2-epimerase (non-hydrolysing)